MARTNGENPGLERTVLWLDRQVKERLVVAAAKRHLPFSEFLRVHLTAHLPTIENEPTIAPPWATWGRRK